MSTVAPRRIVLFGGSRDGLRMDAPIDATEVVVPAFEPNYAANRAAGDMLWALLAADTIRYRDSGRVDSSGAPVFELCA